MIGLAGIVALISGFLPFHMFAIVPLAGVTIWEALGLLSNIIAPLVGALVAVIIWLHKRLNELEDAQDDVENSVFGSDRDALNEGVLIQVRNLNGRLDEIRQKISEINKKQEELEREQQDD